MYDGNIVALGTPQEPNEKFIPEDKAQLDGHALAPGFVNAHTHAAMTLFRGLADDIPLYDWLNKHIWPLENQFVVEDFVRTGTRLAVAEMLRGGATCFNDMYLFLDKAGEVASTVGIRVVLGLIVIEMPTVWARIRHHTFHEGLKRMTRSVTILWSKQRLRHMRLIQLANWP